MFIVVIVLSLAFLLASIGAAIYICILSWRLSKNSHAYASDVIALLNTDDFRDSQTGFLQFPITDWEISHTEIEKGEEIGSGAFGVVYKGTWRENTVAIKEMRKGDLSDEELEQFKLEAAMMRIRASPYVITFYGICSSPLAIVTEYMENGSVEQMLQNLKKKK